MLISLDSPQRPEGQGFMATVSGILVAAGHQVVVSGSGEAERLAAECGMAIVWDGEGDPMSRIGVMKKTPILRLDSGWLSPADTFQMAFGGLNALSRWSWGFQGPSTRLSRPPTPDGCGYALVILQDPLDSGVARFSPWFRTQEGLLAHVSSQSARRLLAWAPEGVRVSLGAMTEKVDLIAPGALEHALTGADFVATINSKYAVQAIADGKPVLCFGHSCYRHRNVVYCLDDRLLPTWQAIRNCESGYHLGCLDLDWQQGFISLLQANQLPRRMLGSALKRTISKISKVKSATAQL